MSDNISPDEIKRRLVLFLRIPAEVWTDVLKLLPRSILVKNIAPACFRLKEISDKNVKNVHVIESANQFTRKLKNDDPDTIKQLEHLAGNKCQLAGQFKLSKVRIGEKSQFRAILRHWDLFSGCKIELVFDERNKDSTFFLECLTELEKATPVVIEVCQRVDQVVDFWHHPTFQNCSRVDLYFYRSLSLSAAIMMNIFAWLHHQPNGVDCDGSADQQVRCLILWGYGQNHIDWFSNRCAEDIQQGQELADRRPCVLSFECWESDWTGFAQFHRIENKSTGEVLLLDRMIDDDGHQIEEFRLRRCLAEEEDKRKAFYAEIFTRDEGYDEFKTDEKTTEVMIG